jgi:hypothetical protein
VKTRVTTRPATLRAAADELDDLWKFDAARGLRDGHGGEEYRRVSMAPRLRAMADEIDPPDGGNTGADV